MDGRVLLDCDPQLLREIGFGHTVIPRIRDALEKQDFLAAMQVRLPEAACLPVLPPLYAQRAACLSEAGQGARLPRCAEPASVMCSMPGCCRPPPTPASALPCIAGCSIAPLNKPSLLP